MVAQPQKPASQLQGHRSGRGRANAPHPDATPANVVEMLPIPPAPEGILVQTREAWDEFWKTDLARLVDRRMEGRAIIYRYFTLFDEWLRAYRSYRRRRVVNGSTGQPVANPAFKTWMALETALERIEKEQGLTTKQRLIFGLQASRLRDELDDLNGAYDGEEEPEEDEFEVPDGVVVIPARGRRGG